MRPSALHCREDSDPRNIGNAEMVALRGFTTKVIAWPGTCLTAW